MDADEVFYIEDFKIPDEIFTSLRDSHSCQNYSPNGKIEKTDRDLKAIFIGTGSIDDSVYFQHIGNSMFLTNKPRLIWKNGTFTKESGAGFYLSSNVDCIYLKSRLYFTSFKTANMVMSLSSYYKKATDDDLKIFCDKNIHIDDVSSFCEKATDWTRRRIMLINDLKVFENFESQQIENMARSSGIAIELRDGKVYIPSDPREQKKVIAFLAEDVYKGPFSEKVYLSGAKNTINEQK